MRRAHGWPGGGRKLQWARRSAQAIVLLLLVLIPIFSLYESLRNQRDEPGIASRWDTRMVDAAVGDLDRPERITQAVRGSVWTAKAGDLVVSDPLAVADFVAASRALAEPFVLTALIPVLLSLLLGRFYCGWLCPADLLFEAAGRVRRAARIETDVTFARSLKYAVLGAGAAAGALFGTQIFAEIYPPRIVSGEIYLFVTFGAFGAGAWFFLTLVAFEIFVSRRFWCRYVCPGGALFSLLGRFRLVRLKVDPRSCTHCALCNKTCEFGLDVMSGRIGAECNNCGYCIRACAPGSLAFRASLPPRDGLDLLLPVRSAGEARRPAP